MTRYTLATPIDQERWITEWEFQPRQRSRVERAVLGVAMDGRIASWLPPEGAVTFPEGVARRLPPRSTLTVDVYYRKAATAVAEGGRVGVYFGAAPRHQLRHRSLACGTTIVDEAMDVLAVEPTTSEAGAAIEALARRPDRPGVVRAPGAPDGSPYCWLLPGGRTKTHRAHILQRLDIHNTAALVLYAVRRGVISCSPSLRRNYNSGRHERGVPRPLPH